MKEGWGYNPHVESADPYFVQTTRCLLLMNSG